jgi:hypothetical protein
MLQSRRYSRDGNELPATLRRSCQQAQDTFTGRARARCRFTARQIGADRAAFTALQEKFEKRGDHWIATRHRGD